MKQELFCGNVVDDGTGDPLRIAGQKIKGNFDEIYDELGDTQELHPAGSWKVVNKPTLDVEFGKAYAVDTRTTKIIVNLPKGKINNYSDVIKLRDAWQSWSKNGIELRPAKGDTIKGSAKPVTIAKNNADLELVYVFPGRWEYRDTQRIDKISTSDINSVARTEIIVEKDGQTDFMNVFGGNMYNPANTTVHWRGNLLTYGNKFDKAISEYGSPGKEEGELVELNGKDIRLKYPTEAGDSIIITTYLDGIASWRAAYAKAAFRIIDPSISTEIQQPGKTYILGENKQELIIDLGSNELINPSSCEVLLNGVLLTRVGEIGALSIDGLDETPIQEDIVDKNNLYSGFCTTGINVDIQSCSSSGGIWYEGIGDYRFEYNEDGVPYKILFNTELTHGDVVSVRWYNGEIGSLLELDEILSTTDNRYINRGAYFNLKNRIEYTEYENNVNADKTREAPDLDINSISSINQIFDLIYPIGTIYENAHNPANPGDYMGFGIWVRYAEGKTTVGWDSNENNTQFNRNQQVLDASGAPTKQAGGSIGSSYVKLNEGNIPRFSTEQVALISDKNGDVAIGGCLDDPGQGPGYKKYSESEIGYRLNDKEYINESFPIIQPSITTYKWLRVG